MEVYYPCQGVCKKYKLIQELETSESSLYPPSPLDHECMLPFVSSYVVISFKIRPICIKCRACLTIDLKFDPLGFTSVQLLEMLVIL